MIDGKQVLKQVAGISLKLGLLFMGCGQADKVTTDTNIEESDAHSEAEEKVEAEENTEDIEQMEAETNTEAEVKTEAETNTEVGEQAEPGEKVENCDKIATLLYQGHGSARIITAEGKVIYIDPFMGDGYDIPADLVLMTHGHYDHTQENLITAKNEGCTVIKWSDALKDGEYKNYDLGFVNIETVEAGYNKNHDVSECVGYILTFSDGIKIYFSGDTSTTPSMSGFAEKKLDAPVFRTELGMFFGKKLLDCPSSEAVKSLKEVPVREVRRLLHSLPPKELKSVGIKEDISGSDYDGRLSFMYREGEREGLFLTSVVPEGGVRVGIRGYETRRLEELKRRTRNPSEEREKRILTELVALSDETDQVIKEIQQISQEHSLWEMFLTK